MSDGIAEMLRRADSSTTAVEVLDRVPLVGGYSRVLERVDVRWSRGGTTAETSVVLRSDPASDRELVRTSRQTEYELLRAIEPYVDIAPALALDASGELLGSPAMVMGFVPGRSLVSVIRDQECDDATLRRLVDCSARIHQVPVDVLPSSVPVANSYDDFVAQRLELWRRLATDHVEPLPIFAEVDTLLERFKPPPVPLGLVHGDLQAPNVLVDDSGRLVVLDWELAEVGDPRCDLGNLFQAAAASPPDHLGLRAEEFCRLYCEARGWEQDLLTTRVLKYFEVFGIVNVISELLVSGTALARGENRSLVSAFALLGAMTYHQTRWRSLLNDLVKEGS